MDTDMKPFNLIEFFASVTSRDGRLSLKNTHTAMRLTQCRHQVIELARRESITQCKRIKQARKEIRLVKQLKLKPCGLDAITAEPAINPLDGYVYNLPSAATPTPKNMKLLNKTLVISHRRFWGLFNFQLHKNFDYDFVFINGRTIPKLIGNTLCTDIPGPLSIAIAQELNKPVLRTRITDINYVYKIWYLDKPDELLCKYIKLVDGVHSIASTAKKTLPGYNTKIKNKVIKELEHGASA